LATEDKSQNDQAKQEKKGQPLNRSDFFHPLKNDVTVSVPRVRDEYPSQFVKDLYFNVRQKSSA
jgi:hypothetical protein